MTTRPPPARLAPERTQPWGREVAVAPGQDASRGEPVWISSGSATVTWSANKWLRAGSNRALGSSAQSVGCG